MYVGDRIEIAASLPMQIAKEEIQEWWDFCSHLNLVGHSQVHVFRKRSIWYYVHRLQNALFGCVHVILYSDSFNDEKNISSNLYLSSLILLFPSLRWTCGNDTTEDEWAN